MPPDDKFDKFNQSQSIDAESKANLKAVQATDAHTQAMQRQTRAMKDNSQAWGRLRDEQTTFLERLKQTTNQLRGATNDFAGLGSAAGGFMNTLKQSTTITSIYNRKLEAMRKGQEAYTSSLIATTGNLTKAMDQSQQYVNAVHDSYRSAVKMSGEWRVETKALQQAVDDLNARFATQIAVSGDAKGAIEGMRKEALIMSKYIGTSMQDVMDSWQERLQQNIGSLDDARNEMVAVAYQADKYAKEISKLGDAYLKTGNIGKKEFLDLVRSVGRELKTGTVDAAGYARAITGILAASKKRLQTTNEQRESVEALKRLMDSMTKEGSEGEIWGLQAAAKVRDTWNDLSNIQDQGLRRRLEEAKIATRDMGDVQQRRYIMNVLRGSAAGNAMMLRLVAQKAGKDLTTEVIRDLGGTNTMIASQLADGIKNDSIAQNFDKKAAKESKEGQKEQIEVWKKDIEDLVKATHTPKDTEFKLIAEVEKIRKLIEYWASKNILTSLLTQGGMIGGNMVLNKLMTGSFMGVGGAGGAGGGLGGLFGGGATTVGAATGTTTAAAAVPGAAGGASAGVVAAGTAAVVGSFLAGVAAGTAADYGFGKAIDEGLLGKKEAKLSKLSGDSTFSAWASRGGPDEFAKRMLLVGPQMAAAAKVWTKVIGGDAEGWKMLTEERVLLEGAEFQKRKNIVEQLEKQIKEMKKRDADLTNAERERLKAVQKQKDQIEKTIKKRLDQERKESKAATQRISFEQSKRIGRWMRQAEGGTAADTARALLRSGNITDIGSMSSDIMSQFSMLSDDMKAKFGGDAKDFAKEVQLEYARSQLKSDLGAGWTAKKERAIEGMSQEELITAYKEKYGKSPIAQVEKTTAADIERARERYRDEIEFSWGGGGADVAGATEVETNAKGEMVLKMPGQKLVIKGMSTAVAVQNQKTKSKG